MLSPRREISVLWLVVVATTGGELAGPARAEIVPIAEEGAAVLPLADETTLELRDLTGSVSIRPGSAGEIRFRSSHLSDPEKLILVAVGQDRKRIVMAPIGDDPPTARNLELNVPDDLSLRLLLSDSDVQLTAVGGDVEIEGERLNLVASGLGGSMSLVLTGGSAELRGLQGDLQLRSTNLDADLTGIGGGLYVQQTGGRLEILMANRTVHMELDGTELVANGLHGAFDIDVRRGDASIEGVTAGGSLSLGETALKLKKCTGNIEIQTDSEVTLLENAAQIHVSGYGASLRGVDNRGLLEIRTDSAEVNLEDFDGPIRVQGDNLDVTLKEVYGEILVYTTYSEVVIEDARAPVTVTNEFGSITVIGARDKLEVGSENGDVHLVDLLGPVEVEADGGEVFVSWASLLQTAPSNIRNDGGDVRVRLPSSGGCRLSARARYGSIESDHPAVRVSDDGRSAQGTVNRRSQPVVSVESNGNIFVEGSSPDANGSTRRPR